MQMFWRTQKVLSQIRLVISPLILYLFEDIRNLVDELRIKLVKLVSDLLRSTKIHTSIKNISINLGIVKFPVNTLPSPPSQPSVQQLATTVEKPLIFASYCAGVDFPGNLKFCGGTKELNYLLKLLRNHGYEAYMVTYDGSYEPWLLDHQPHISLEEFRGIISSNANVRCVTSWAIATAFIQASPSLYFWDMELAHTEHDHFPVLANLYRRKIRNTASISRTIQAWHMAHFQRPSIILPNLLDESLWLPLPSERQPCRVGYMNEGSHTETYLELIQNVVKEKGLDLEFQKIKGVEAEVLEGMRSCEVFLAMNIGKEPLWGEGCPRTVIEALSTGCVVIAFDIIGNRETIQDNFNSILVSRYRPDLMAVALVRLYTIPGELDRLRTNSLSLIQACHTLEARWPAVKEFLDL